MSDTTNRQAYVFLQDGDVIQDGDEWYYNTSYYWVKCPKQSYGEPKELTKLVRRPIATPEQTDGLTVWDEYAKIYFEYSIKAGFGKVITAKDTKAYADEMMKARANK